MREGYWRLPEIEAIEDLPEAAKETLDIPNGAEVVKVTNRWAEDGPIVVSVQRPRTPEQIAEQQRQINLAVRHWEKSTVERLHKEPRHRKNLEKLLKLYENGDLASGNFDINSRLFRELSGDYS